MAIAVLPSSALADTAPTVTINPIAPADVNFNSAEVSGTVNPNGGPSGTEWFFEYVTKAEADAAAEPALIPWGITCPCGNFNEGEEVEIEGEMKVPAESSDPIKVPLQPDRVGSLAPGIAYLIRLTASNAGGSNSTSPVEFETEAVDPPSATEPIVTQITGTSAHITATLNSGGTNPGEASTYSLACSPICPSLEGTAKDGSGPLEPISGHGTFDLKGDLETMTIEGSTNSGEALLLDLDASGLIPHQKYTVNVSVQDAAGLSDAKSLSPPFETVAIAPSVETNLIHGYVYPTSARFLGTVNPNNSQVQSCVFEYGTTTAYGHGVPCDSYAAGNALACSGPITEECAEADEAGHTPYTVGAEADGLAPETEYHYRLLVDNGTGGPSGGGDRTLTTPPAPAPQGECPNEAIRKEQGAAALALPQCMAYELISPAQTGGIPIGGAAVGLDGDHAWVNNIIPLNGEQRTGSNTNFAAERTEDGWVLHDLAPAPELSAGLQARSADSSRVIVYSCETIGIPCSEAHPARFERIEADGSRTLMVEAQPSEGRGIPAAVGVSTDLRRLFLETETELEPLLPEDTHTHGVGLYASNDGALEFLGLDPEGHALPCGEVLANDWSGHQGGNGFEQNGISADGATVFFESPDPAVAGSPGCEEPVDLYMRRDGQTTNVSAPTDGNPDLGATYVGNSRDGNLVYFTTTSQLVASDTDELLDLYSYDAGTENVSPITTGAGITTKTGGPGVVVSPEGDYVYFVAERAIAGAVDGPGTNGAQNLFVYHAGGVRRIATTYLAGSPYFGKALGSGTPSISTPDGRHLLFLSTGQLTGQPTGQELQFFQYDASSDSLACVSCRADGGVPTNGSGIANVQPVANKDQRFQSDDGRSVAFVSRDALLPQDTNGKPDPYLWREGHLYLLDGGQSQNTNSDFGTIPDGSSAFFATSENMTGGKIGAGVKFYVARSGGGFPAAQAAPICDSAEICHGPAPLAPAPPAQGSLGFIGRPNPKPTRCKKKNCKPNKHHHKKHHAKRHHRRDADSKRGAQR